MSLNRGAKGPGRFSWISGVWGLAFSGLLLLQVGNAWADGLSFQEKSISFEDVYPGEVVEYVFVMTNIGEAPVRILGVKST